MTHARGLSSGKRYSCMSLADAAVCWPSAALAWPAGRIQLTQPMLAAYELDADHASIMSSPMMLTGQHAGHAAGRAAAVPQHVGADCARVHGGLAGAAPLQNRLAAGETRQSRCCEEPLVLCLCSLALHEQASCMGNCPCRMLCAWAIDHWPAQHTSHLQALMHCLHDAGSL